MIYGFTILKEIEVFLSSERDEGSRGHTFTIGLVYTGKRNVPIA